MSPQASLIQKGHGDSVNLGDIVDKYAPELEKYYEIYKDLHQYPELGKLEYRTAGVAAEELKRLGYEVHTKIGGTGVVGILKNGEGKKILLRADMDSLPIKEDTGLPYASHVYQETDDGEFLPVMAACGHDMHVTCLLAVAKLMVDARAEWKGTLICLFQPNEEGGAGAQAMVDDGLYEKIPIPDLILGQHVDYWRAGTVRIIGGTFMATADSFRVIIHGRGGHGSQPQVTVDPILISAYILVRLQSIVSRMVAPLDAAVVTCGSIHAGTTENVIPDTAEFKLNIRTYSPKTRQTVLNAIHSIIKAECSSAGTPKDPEIISTTRFPLTENDPILSETLSGVFKEYLGANSTEKMEVLAGSEDVSNLAKPNKTPYAFWFWGGTDQQKWDDAVAEDRVDRLPRNHMATFAPVIEPTMSVGVRAMALAALRFLA